jgi:hypothetical protein
MPIIVLIFVIFDVLVVNSPADSDVISESSHSHTSSGSSKSTGSSGTTHSNSSVSSLGSSGTSSRVSASNKRKSPRSESKIYYCFEIVFLTCIHLTYIIIRAKISILAL